MKQVLRYFSVGLLTAGVIMLIGLQFFDEKGIEEYSAEELIPLVEDSGYYVLSGEEYITLTVPSSESSAKTAEANKKPAENTEQKSTNTEEKKESDTEETKESNTEEADEEKEKEKEKTQEENTNEAASYKISIKPGMLTSEISSLLEENNIIEDAFEFDQYLNENDYSLYVQLGEYTLTSDMSFYEIAETIAN
ncbi:endolytic transglycosylase MltG [Oceanobacillus piezotolerans]|uniref:endolytic transglycosylase MltG n=1 Tax=Oceanobacillus piezotolerans TaxID=2448030 RepID=UPI001FE980B8|nr:endolytic transglycosylase MltG [Oceanobacillus piezotolerans]